MANGCGPGLVSPGHNAGMFSTDASVGTSVPLSLKDVSPRPVTNPWREFNATKKTLVA